MLQSTGGTDPSFRIVVKHPQEEVLELEIVLHRVARFSAPPTPGTAGLHPDDVMNHPGVGQPIDLAVSGRVEAVGAVR